MNFCFLICFLIDDILKVFNYLGMSEKTKKTNWDVYYGKTYKITSFTRKTTERLLLKLFRTYGENIETKKIVELGGANSCFYDAIKSKISPRWFHVIDNNQKGLDLFAVRVKNDSTVSFENLDVLNISPQPLYDIAFSIGLIEHFDPEGTAKAIKAHFDSVKNEGIVIISFPTPTFLYLIARKMAEWMGIWFFHDERPLGFIEVIGETNKYGDLLFKKINWLVILTQGFVVVKKRTP